jgi:hypothetical protein
MQKPLHKVRVQGGYAIPSSVITRSNSDLKQKKPNHRLLKNKCIPDREETKEMVEMIVEKKERLFVDNTTQVECRMMTVER